MCCSRCLRALSLLSGQFVGDERRRCRLGRCGHQRLVWHARLELPSQLYSSNLPRSQQQRGLRRPALARRAPSRGDARRRRSAQFFVSFSRRRRAATRLRADGGSTMAEFMLPLLATSAGRCSPVPRATARGRGRPRRSSRRAARSPAPRRSARTSLRGRNLAAFLQQQPLLLVTMRRRARRRARHRSTSTAAGGGSSPRACRGRDRARPGPASPPGARCVASRRDSSPARGRRPFRPPPTPPYRRDARRIAASPSRRSRRRAVSPSCAYLTSLAASLVCRSPLAHRRARSSAQSARRRNSRRATARRPASSRCSAAAPPAPCLHAAFRATSHVPTSPHPSLVSLVARPPPRPFPLPRNSQVISQSVVEERIGQSGRGCDRPERTRR